MASIYPSLEASIGPGWAAFIEELLLANEESALKLAANQEPPLPTKGLVLELAKLSDLYEGRANVGLTCAEDRLRRLLLITDVKLSDRFKNFLHRVINEAANRAARLSKKGDASGLAAFLKEPIGKYQSPVSNHNTSSRRQVDDFPNRFPKLHNLLEGSSFSSYTLADLCRPSTAEDDIQGLREDILSKVLADCCPLSHLVVLELQTMWTLVGCSRSGLVAFLQKVDWSGLWFSTPRAIENKISRLVVDRADAARRSKKALAAFLLVAAQTGFVVQKPNSEKEPTAVPTISNRLRRVQAEQDHYKGQRDEAHEVCNGWTS
jgi:hypothetical protein